ncbi:hypothetical protein BC830DRAFT_1135875 [Chytriomyces sp. MP71]|nr:hypothetical protein BC830DRAFT_1135875 [Chytriomyces sp. MP71]
MQHPSQTDPRLPPYSHHHHLSSIPEPHSHASASSPAPLPQPSSPFPASNRDTHRNPPTLNHHHSHLAHQSQHPLSMHPPSPQQAPSIGLSGIYSQSGFDLLGIMSRVYHRPNQKIPLGNVDLSASFTISNPRLPDDPIVYASESFSRLTGYGYNEVLGFNCRFLQAPSGPGSVVKGSERGFTDSKVVYQIREHVNRHMECQFSLINYRKSGEPFINLITIIPLFAPGTSNVEYFVGFQVDLVEQPRAILNRCKEGNYVAGYKNSQEQLNSNESDSRGGHSDVDISVDGNGAAGGSQTFGSGVARGTGFGGTNAGQHGQHTMNQQQQQSQLHRNLLPIPDNVTEVVVDGGDFVFILSMRARFLYVPPQACEELLGFTSAELCGKKLQDHVHAADLLSAIRELRNAKPGAVVSFLCRFRKRTGGYLYLDVNGHVYEGNNSNKKCFVLSGRPAYLPITANPPCAPTSRDLWLKMSPQGVILYSSCLNYSLYGVSVPAPGSSAPNNSGPSQTSSSAASPITSIAEDSTNASSFNVLVGTNVHDLISVEDRVTFQQCLFLACQTQSVMECVVRRFGGPSISSQHSIGAGMASSTSSASSSEMSRVIVNLIPETGPNARHIFMRMGPQHDGSASAWMGNTAGADSKPVIDLLKVGDESSTATSLHYEINGLKVQNKKLREEMGSISLLNE